MSLYWYIVRSESQATFDKEEMESSLKKIEEERNGGEIYSEMKRDGVIETQVACWPKLKAKYR